ncbi:MAG: PEGA domain-containing protein [candidate division Zixibacteria bacterium]|nr:PEGA domain-containing protein [candidate division Zixibacteria bacterium]
MKKVEISIGKRVAALLVVLLFVASSSSAQTDNGTVVTIRSNPIGCTVILSGDLTVAGVTPTTFIQNLRGYYEITAHHHGYETYHSSVLLSGSDLTTIDIELVPKTRFKAGMRSLLIPGWGQTYSGSRTKGVFLTVATIAAGATAGILHLRYDDKRDEYNELKERFENTREVSKREAMLDELYEAQKAAYDAGEARKIGVSILAGVWLYNFLDAILFFPDFTVKISGASLGLQPQFAPEGVKLVGVIEF